MNYTIFSNQFLVAAYLIALDNGGERIRSGDVLDKYEFDVRPMWVHTALEDWRKFGWISGKGTIGDEKSQPIWFTGQGLMQAETLLNIAQFQPRTRPLAISITDTAEAEIVPAADRLVRLDHNDPSLSEIKQSTSDLRSQLLDANDVGSLTAEEVEVAANEVQLLEEQLSARTVRFGSIRDRATSTLKWIGQQAASAVVGAAALALLAAIAAFFGFIF